MSQTLIIGDIHGCFDELQALLDAAGLGADDAIISLGDLVDRGPSSRAVVDFFATTPQASAIMGNHERKHMRHARGELKLSLSQQITRLQYADDGADYDTAVTFMATLPLYLELPQAILVHGYLEPNVPLAAQRPTVLCGTMSGDKYLNTHYDRPWYELVQRDKPIIVGHANYDGGSDPFIYQDRVFGLDTDCYRGRRLTGLLLPSFRMLSVPARTNHWSETRRNYRYRLVKPINPKHIDWEAQAKWLARMTQRETLTPDQMAEVTAVQQQREQALALVAPLYGYMQQQHTAVLAHLHTTLPEYATMSTRDQGRHYNAALGERHPRERTLLHQLRVGDLTLENLPTLLRTPQRLLELAAALDLIP